MQMMLDFGAAEDLGWARERLRSCFGRPGPALAMDPTAQLVKSIISSRTRDAVSMGAYLRLVAAHPDWRDLAWAAPAAIHALIADVEHAESKARHLGAALRIVAASRPDFDLTFLGRMRVADALAWLERLPGAGRKVAAATLNFSTLHMPAFVLDTHVLRIVRRFGFVAGRSGTRIAYERIMSMLDGWSAAELEELHVLMKRLGQTACRPAYPACPTCPLGRRCAAAARRRRAEGG